MKINKLVIFILVFFLVGCSDSFKDAFKKSYDESFKKSFRSSFITSCIKSGDKNELETLCTCVADDLLASFTVKELKNTKKIKEHVQNISVPKCMKTEE